MAYLLTAFAAEAVAFPFMRGMTIVGPLLPTNVHLLGQESLLCQLQSRLRGELSVVAPAVGHDFLIFGQNCGELLQLFDWGT
jgi:hypothetical protein